MSDKQIVNALLERMPEDASLRDIAQEIEFIAGVKEGLGQLDRGEGLSLPEVEALVASWTTK
ncbi:MAG: hypothetical protein WC378_12155 [Opitutaceae bacterium]|jgi:predicted transcriptional regulator